MSVFKSVDKPKSLFLAVFTPHFVFPLTCAAEKHLISEKTLDKRFFKSTGGVPAGIERSLKIFDFRANGIPVGECVDFFDTLKLHRTAEPEAYRKRLIHKPHRACIKRSHFFLKALFVDRSYLFKQDY